MAVRLSRKNTGWSLYVSCLLAAVAPILYLVWDLLPRLTTYGSLEYELWALAALGTAGCLGHLVVRAYQNSGDLADIFMLLRIAPVPDRCSNSETSAESADWPLLVALIFGRSSYFSPVSEAGSRDSTG